MEVGAKARYASTPIGDVGDATGDVGDNAGDVGDIAASDAMARASCRFTRTKKGL